MLLGSVSFCMTPGMQLLPLCSLAVLAGLLPAGTARAAWTDRIQGGPALDLFSARDIGQLNVGSTLVQDTRGRLFVGGDRLLVYDGSVWKNYPLADSQAVTALCFDRHGRLWAGGDNELGYFTETAPGDFVFTSLRNELPAGHGQIGEACSCEALAGHVFFICKSKVLGWDGVRFTTWEFPTRTRLFPAPAGDECWFTHPETGLYRLTADGPSLEFTPDQLPPTPPLWLEHHGGRLLLVSRDGVFEPGKPDRPLCSTETLDFLHSNPASSAARLPDGNLVLGTLGGLVIVSPSGRLLRVLGHEDGLPSNPVSGLLVDREHFLWISTAARAGLCRIVADGTVSAFREWQRNDFACIAQLATCGRSLLAATDSGVYELQPAARGTSHFAALPLLPSISRILTPWHEGVLLGNGSTFEYFDGRGCTPLGFFPSSHLAAATSSPNNPNTIYCVEDRNLVRLQRDPEGKWQHELLATLPDEAENIHVDSLEHLWLGSLQHGVWRFNPATRHIDCVHNGARPGFPTEFSRVTGRGRQVYFFAARQAFVDDVQTGGVHRVPCFPDLHCYACLPSPDGKRLYTSFERERNGSTPAYGLGVFRLDPRGEPADWTELQVPKLEAVGLPTTLLVTEEDGEDALWIGGSESLIRLKPAELSPVRPPARPWLQVGESPGPPAPANREPSYDFVDHHLSIHAGSPEIDQRKDLWFQTRLAPGPAEWSRPAPGPAFEFSDLKDGHYQLEVRTENSAGLVSEPASFVFRIRPPWYRSPWAFSFYVLAMVGGLYGTIRVRERVIRARNHELEGLVRERTADLVKANAAKDEFLAGISHEIRNPLNGVVGLAATIDSSRLDPGTQAHFSQLRHCATHLSSLIEDLLDFSRLQADTVKLDPQPFDLRDLVTSVCALCAAESAHLGIPVETAVSPSAPRFFIGDAPRLRQILLNYVVNALKYSGRGKVYLTVWCRDEDPARPTVTFAVSDDGPGIAPEEQARLFTRFARGAAARTGRVPGTGLGLSLCKTLGEKMGGRLWLESEPGNGSTFYFEVALPVTTADRAGLEPMETPDNPPRSLQALVVDDEEYNRVALSALLAEAGYLVSTAPDSDQAQAAVLDGNFDVVFLDLRLPGKSGLEVARLLRAMPHLDPQLLLIATTASASEAVMTQCLEAGMNGFLTKPVSLEKIRAVLATAAGRPLPPPAAPLPSASARHDPLQTLRLFASRKGRPLQTQLMLFLDELEEEHQALIDAVRRHDPGAALAAHRLIGCLAWLQATPEADLVRKIETDSARGLWVCAEPATASLEAVIADLRERIRRYQ